MRRSLISAIEKLIFSFSYLIFNMHPFLYARGAFLALVEDIPLEPFFYSFTTSTRTLFRVGLNGWKEYILAFLHI
jgi:hypothetical protein